MRSESPERPVRPSPDLARNATEPLALVKMYLQAGAYAEAENLLRVWLSRDENDEVQGRLLLAESLWRLGRLDEAREQITVLENRFAQTHEVALMDIRLLIEAGSYREAVQKYSRYSESCPADATLLQIVFNVANCHVRLNNLSRARQLFRQVLGGAIGSQWEEGSARAEMALATLDRTLGDWSEAEKNLKSARSRYAKIGLLRGYVLAHLNLGYQQLWSGSLEEAAESLREAVRISTEMGDRRIQASAHPGLGLVYVRQGDFSRARREFSMALRACRSQRSPRRFAIAFEYIGELHLAEGKLSKAEWSLAKSLRIAERISPEGDIVPEVKRRLAQVSLARGDHATALLFAREAARGAGKLGDRYERAVALRVEGEVLCAIGRVRDGNRRFRVALSVLDRLGEKLESARIREILRTPRQRITRFSDAEVLALLQQHGIVGSSSMIRRVIQDAALVAPTRIPILIFGETGTGKELFARAIHKIAFPCDAPLVTFNCATCPPDLLDAELFGYERGAFTGAASSRSGLVRAAHRGTLFLDEIGELREESQARLLRMLDSGEVRSLGSDVTTRVDVRVLAATHVNLQERIRRGRFREDLFYRLAGARLVLPPLRERGDDLEALIAWFTEEARRNIRPGFAGFESEALQAMRGYPWPGNVRELMHEIHRIAATTPDGVKVAQWTPASSLWSTAVPPLGVPRNQVLDDPEALRRLLHERSVSMANLARQLGVSKAQLYRTLRRHGIDPSNVQKADS